MRRESRFISMQRERERERERERISLETLLYSSSSFFRFVRVARYATLLRKFQTNHVARHTRVDTNPSFANFIAVALHPAKFIPRLVKSYCRDNEIKVFRMNARAVRCRSANHLNFFPRRKIECISTTTESLRNRCLSHKIYRRIL